MLREKLKSYKIILASRSPRRQQMLRELNIDFEVVAREYDETYPLSLSGEQIALLLARKKADVFRNDLSDNEIVITADTIVWCKGQVLGKPENKNDAFRMIRLLSGDSHEVITGVSIISIKKEIVFYETTKVTFSDLSDEEINFYIKEFEPYDKAGAYGIQEWIGQAACTKIEGSYFNVVGLPVQRVYSELKKFGD